MKVMVTKTWVRTNEENHEGNGQANVVKLS